MRVFVEWNVCLKSMRIFQSIDSLFKYLCIQFAYLVKQKWALEPAFRLLDTRWNGVNSNRSVVPIIITSRFLTSNWHRNIWSHHKKSIHKKMSCHKISYAIPFRQRTANLMWMAELARANVFTYITSFTLHTSILTINFRTKSSAHYFRLFNNEFAG